jgi:hypothetical protein
MAIRTQEGKDHLNWSKGRALEYLEKGDISGAWTSMLSDLTNNEELAAHPAIELGNMLFFSGLLDTKEGMKKFIEDFE